MMRVKEWFKTQLQRLGQEYDYSMEDSEAIQLICQQLLTRKETMNAKIVPESIQEKDPTNEEEKESSESCQRDEIVPDKLE